MIFLAQEVEGKRALPIPAIESRTLLIHKNLVRPRSPLLPRKPSTDGDPDT